MVFRKNYLTKPKMRKKKLKMSFKTSSRAKINLQKKKHQILWVPLNQIQKQQRKKNKNIRTLERVLRRCWLKIISKNIRKKRAKKLKKKLLHLNLPKKSKLQKPKKNKRKKPHVKNKLLLKPKKEEKKKNKEKLKRPNTKKKRKNAEQKNNKKKKKKNKPMKHLETQLLQDLQELCIQRKKKRNTIINIMIRNEIQIIIQII